MTIVMTMEDGTLRTHRNVRRIEEEDEGDIIVHMAYGVGTLEIDRVRRQEVIKVESFILNY